MHKLSHQGIKATQKMIERRFIWTNINKNVRAWAYTCLMCPQTKIFRHRCLFIFSFFPSSKQFARVYVAIVGRPLGDWENIIGTICNPFLALSISFWGPRSDNQ